MYKISFTVVILISAVIINCNHSPAGPDEHKVNEILPT